MLAALRRSGSFGSPPSQQAPITATAVDCPSPSELEARMSSSTPSQLRAMLRACVTADHGHKPGRHGDARAKAHGDARAKAHGEKTHGRTAASNATHDFLRFSGQLYCSGAMEQACRVGERLTSAGVCMWYKHRSANAVREAEMNRTLYLNRWPSDRWDPSAAGVRGFRHFGADAAEACVRGKRVFIAGDSTTRDTFYEFATVAGHPMFTGARYREARAKYWPNNHFEPITPFSSGGSDIRGACTGDYSKHRMCFRDERIPLDGGAETRLGYQFLTRGNSTWEVTSARSSLADRPADVAFVQCPIYEYFRPDAYNYSKSKAERARLGDDPVGPRHFEAMGVACLQYINTAIRAAGGERTRVFVLGITPLPAWTRKQGGERVEATIFQSINAAMGIKCRRTRGGASGGGGYFLAGAGRRADVIPVDRYAVTGLRRRDAIHPFFNAQFAIVQLMLNHMCPAS